MEHSKSYSQLGRFVVQFQHVESALTELLILMAHTDYEVARILINELGYSQRVNTMNVLFARFIDVRQITDQTIKKEFDELMKKLHELGARRNAMVHSHYWDWKNVEGSTGLLRQNSRLKTKKGMREEQEEELLPQDFEDDFKGLSDAQQKLEYFRLKIIDWQLPNE